MKSVRRLSSEDLLSAGRSLKTPFQLELAADSLSPKYTGSDRAYLEITQLLRVVPGVRLVGLSHWEGKQIVVKLFYQPAHFRRHFRRETAGLDALRDRGIATARTRFTAQTKDAAALLIASDYLQDAKSLALEVEEASEPGSPVQAVCRVIKAIAFGHRQGVWQADIHPDNFLLRGEEVFQIDTAEIQTGNGSQTDGLSAEKSLDNLALFLAQFAVSQDEHIPEYLSQYCGARETGRIREEPEEMLARVNRARSARLDKYEKKLQRETSDHVCRRTSSMYLLYDRCMESEEFERFVADPDSFMPDSQIIKNGNSSTVAMIEIDGRKYILKRYNILGLSHRVKRAVRRSRAVNSWIHASLLTMLGIATGRPYAAIERRSLGLFRSTSYFLSEYIEGDSVMERVARFQKDEKSLSSGSAEIDRIVDAFVSLFSVFECYRISHGDFKASNFIYRESKLYVLDLDSMKRHKDDTTFRKKHGKDLRRFIRNWQGTALAADIETRFSTKFRGR